MTGFLRRDSLARQLRAARPQPPSALVSRIEERVRAVRPRRRGTWRVAVPVAFTGALAAALAAVGGIGYAASSVEHAAKTVSHVFMRAQAHEPVIVRGLSSGGDQYKPGFGWGDPNHNHSGPPGLKRKGGALAPPLTPKVQGDYAMVSTSFTIDEQARLWVSIVTGKSLKAPKLLISQKHSKIGRGLKGAPAKSINYLELVPRTIPLKLAIPKNLLQPGKTYYLRIIARDPQHNRKVLYIPFTA